MSPSAFFRLCAHIQLMPVLESGEETLVGGQAVVEGVMMRAPHSYCVAVRKPGGEIVTEEMPLARMSEKYKIFRYPVFRGVGTLCQALQLGYRATRFSATMALDDPKLAAAAQPAAPAAKEIPGWAFAGPRWSSRRRSSFSLTSMCRYFWLRSLKKSIRPWPATFTKPWPMAASAWRFFWACCTGFRASRTSAACSNIMAPSTRWCSITNRAKP